MIDTHAHLNLGDYTADQEDVIQSALESHIHRIITPGVTFESSFSAYELCQKHPDVFAMAVGIHPNNAEEWTPKVEAQFRDWAQRPEVVAVGETGLDYFWDDCPKTTQHHALRAQIQLAKDTQLPLILHIRDKKNTFEAYEDVLTILSEENAAEVGGVMHCFSGTLEFAKAAIDLNFYLAFGGVLTFKNAKELQAVALEIDLKHLLLETDSPWLTPHPHRGERNEPAYVKLVAQKLAEIKNISPEEVAKTTTENAFKLFKGLKSPR